MSLTLAALCIVIALLIYLFVALLAPERFQ